MYRHFIAYLASASILVAPALASPFSAKRFRHAVAAEAPVDAPPLLPGPYQGNVGNWPQTVQPADITDAVSCANPATYCRQVIADWDLPPYLTISTTTNIPVVAYMAPTPAQYALGITSAVDYVDIACDGGDWVRVESMALNSQTGEQEFYVPLIPAYFADGQHECRFKAVGETGRARVGQGLTIDGSQPVYSLLINTNYNGTLPTQTRIVSPTGVDQAGCGDTLANACRQPWGARDALKASMGSDIGGGIICLMEGTYSYGKTGQNPSLASFPTATQYVTIQPCAGQAKANVIIDTIEGTTSTGGSLQFTGLGIPKIKISGLTKTVSLQAKYTYSARSGSTVPGAETMWIDDVSQPSGASIAAGSRLKALYVTNVVAGTVSGMASYARLVRNVSADTIVNDAFQSTKMILTASLAYFDRYPSATAHPDVWQNFGVDANNVIIRGIVCIAHCAGQAFFSDGNGPGDGVAIVGPSASSIASIGGGAQYKVWQMSGNWKNLFMLEAALSGPINLDGDFTDLNVVNTTCTDNAWEMTAPSAAQTTKLGTTGC